MRYAQRKERLDRLDDHGHWVWECERMSEHEANEARVDVDRIARVAEPSKRIDGAKWNRLLRKGLLFPTSGHPVDVARDALRPDPGRCSLSTRSEERILSRFSSARTILNEIESLPWHHHPTELNQPPNDHHALYTTALSTRHHGSAFRSTAETFFYGTE
jgi:hypothetical protein